jgi:hypothetical protein
VGRLPGAAGCLYYAGLFEAGSAVGAGSCGETGP